MSFPELTPVEAQSRLPEFRVLDVREVHEFHGPLGHIEQAALVPLPTVKERAAELDGPTPLLLVCRSGGRSGKACEILQTLGVGNVTNLSGGMIGWNRAGLPVLYTEPETLTALVDQVIYWIAQVGPLTAEAALEVARKRFERQGTSYEAPTHAAVEEFINFMGESMAVVNPPDLDLSLSSFRRSLAVL